MVEEEAAAAAAEVKQEASWVAVVEETKEEAELEHVEDWMREIRHLL